ncbi:hypothetical protein NEOLEDRAFT_438965 [Neolentinus lepideus HHB14362 ss-1]|uniref:Secreted protein n=1 Tax=Neolentinus lepideus HHB14362 ss-1 TaxID=1314782 RepID=A0A165RX90_9AGAM|nr:hypothetical protein NEOLEDRAFT_438965 [Neolentinus lepideus HHB14362 ss-1]
MYIIHTLTHSTLIGCHCAWCSAAAPSLLVRLTHVMVSYSTPTRGSTLWCDGNVVCFSSAQGPSNVACYAVGSSTWRRLHLRSSERRSLIARYCC